MWLQDTYEGYEGKFWSLPPRKILPKPYGPGHPAMWYAAGNTASYTMAARKGIGVLGFSVGTIDELAAVVEAYKTEIPNAEPIGAFVNDNIMVTTGASVAEDTQQAEAGAPCVQLLTYLQSNVYRYHDTFPGRRRSPCGPRRSQTPHGRDDPVPHPGRDQSAATLITPLSQCRRWEALGADQLVSISG